MSGQDEESNRWFEDAIEDVLRLFGDYTIDKEAKLRYLRKMRDHVGFLIGSLEEKE